MIAQWGWIIFEYELQWYFYNFLQYQDSFVPVSIPSIWYHWFHPRLWCPCNLFGPLLSIFGHFWPFLDIFGHCFLNSKISYLSKLFCSCIKPFNRISLISSSSVMSLYSFCLANSVSLDLWNSVKVISCCSCSWSSSLKIEKKRIFIFSYFVDECHEHLYRLAWLRLWSINLGYTKLWLFLQWPDAKEILIFLKRRNEEMTKMESQKWLNLDFRDHYTVKICQKLSWFFWKRFLFT